MKKSQSGFQELNHRWTQMNTDVQAARICVHLCPSVVFGNQRLASEMAAKGSERSKLSGEAETQILDFCATVCETSLARSLLCFLSLMRQFLCSLARNHCGRD